MEDGFLPMSPLVEKIEELKLPNQGIKHNVNQPLLHFLAFEDVSAKKQFDQSMEVKPPLQTQCHCKI